jgi:UDP-glucuronate 4-epimerase
MSIRNRRFLVTGGAGFIGSHLVDHLLGSGAASVTVIDDFNDFYDPRTKEANVAAHLLHPRYRLVRGDIHNRETLARLFATDSFDAILHLAARAGVRPSLTHASLYEETNIAGTLEILEQARLHAVKEMVFASSSSVYGPTALPPFREDAPLAPISPYAATKAAGELLAHTYSYLHGMRIVCLRFFTVYGARQRPDLAIHKFARLIMDGQPIPVFGDGATERDYTYIDDIVHGIDGAVRYVHEGATAFEIVNLGESQTVTLNGLIAQLEDALGRRAIIDRRPAQPGDMPRTHADISKARRLLGYRPVTPLHEGLRKFVQWFQPLADEMVTHA